MLHKEVLWELHVATITNSGPRHDLTVKVARERTLINASNYLLQLPKNLLRQTTTFVCTSSAEVNENIKSARLVLVISNITINQGGCLVPAASRDKQQRRSMLEIETGCSNGGMSII